MIILIKIVCYIQIEIIINSLLVMILKKFNYNNLLKNKLKCGLTIIKKELISFLNKYLTKNQLYHKINKHVQFFFFF